MAKRILGLDLGSKTVGVAVSDSLFMTAQPLETITRTQQSKLRKTLARIGELIAEYEPESIVLGLPLNMDGSEGERCEKSREFADMLKKRFSLPVIFVNEQLTTVAADEILAEMEVPAADRKQYIDKIAAAIILQDYINSNRSVNDL